MWGPRDLAQSVFPVLDFPYRQIDLHLPEHVSTSFAAGGTVREAAAGTSHSPRKMAQRYIRKALERRGGGSLPGGGPPRSDVLMTHLEVIPLLRSQPVQANQIFHQDLLQ